MRKLMFTVLASGVFALAATGLAVGATKPNRATPHRTGARCGTRYTPVCTKPKLKVRELPPACFAPSSTITLPPITVTSNAGIRKIVVTSRGKTVKKVTFKGAGPTTHTLSGVTVLSSETPGMYTVKVATTDVTGKTVSKTLRFSICKPAPVFTG